MKTIIIILLALLSFPAIADEFGHDAKIKALFDAWMEKHEAEVRGKVRRCYKNDGVNSDDPERTDPPYKAWRAIRTKQRLHEEFAWDKHLHEEFPELWRKLNPSAPTYDYNYYNDIIAWSREHVLQKPEGVAWPTDMDDPPPEGWTSDKVDDQGRATDAKGQFSTGSPNWAKYFWLPMLLSVITGAYVSANGGPGTLTFFCVLIAYAYATDPWQVFACFFSVYIVLVLAVVYGFKVVLAGLGIGKK